MKLDRDIKQRVERVLDTWDVEYSYSHHSRHARLTIETGSKSRFLTLPVSPSDRRAVFNLIRDLKKVLNDLGAEQITVN